MHLQTMYAIQPYAVPYKHTVTCLECDSRRGLDWRQDLLDSSKQRVIKRYSSLLHTG
jgi:hypothetical protein